MKMYVGTSGYSYPEWKGRFYPNDLPARRMLEFYAENFQTVEINSTFTSIPGDSVVKAWANAVGDGFRFALKAPQRITHFRRLKNAEESLTQFLTVAGALKKRLGPLFFQLPPNLKKDLPRLREFLLLLPKRYRVAFEFRHQSWFDDEVFKLLRKHRTALCIADADNDLEVPFVATANWGYLRLRRPKYGIAAMKKWSARIQEQNWRDVFVYFKHDDEGHAPHMAKKLASILAS